MEGAEVVLYGVSKGYKESANCRLEGTHISNCVIVPQDYIFHLADVCAITRLQAITHTSKSKRLATTPPLCGQCCFATVHMRTAH
eukprot:COSAG02_NODE_1218_length_13814_cov_250.988844_8_plen_85_part_00